MKKQNYTSYRALYTAQKGITLIALIITIIVMLILVGVTVNVALTGGLFTKATDASKQMQIEAEKEELLSAVVAAIGYDGKVDLEEIQLPKGWTGTNGTYASPKRNTYAVDENGKITVLGIEDGTGSGNIGENKPVEGDENAEALIAELEAYFSTENKGYLEIAEMLGETIESDLLTYPMEFLEFGANIDSDLETGYMYLYLKYDNKVYSVNYREGSEKYSDILYTGWNLNREVKEYEGKWVYYDSNNDGTDEKWIVLYNENSKIQLMAAGMLKYDIKNINGAEDLDSSGTIDEVERGVYFYNNMFRIVNDAAKLEITENTYKESVRALGTIPEDPYRDEAGYWDSYSVWNLKDADKTKPNYRFKIKKGDNNLDFDHKKVVCLEIPSKMADYYGQSVGLMYVSRFSGDANDLTSTFSPWIAVRVPQNYLMGSMNIINYSVTGVLDEKRYYPTLVNTSFNYFPVVTLKSVCTIDTSSGDGSINNPYTIIK